MKNPLVSFVVPSRDRIEWVAECVSGLLAQTLDEIEVVIVNDGSIDGTKEFLNEWLGDNKRVQIYHNEKSVGGGLSRNKGNELAKAPLIAVCDDDDCYPIQRAERVVEFFEKYPEGHMMTAPYVRIGYDNDVLEYFNGEHFNEKLFKETGSVNYFCHPGCAYTKKDILEAGGYKAETKLQTDDLQLVYDWIHAGKKITIQEGEYLCMHRVLPHSMMARMRGFKEEWGGKS